MTAWLTSADLRALADALDAFEVTTTRTGIAIAQYSNQHVRLGEAPSEVHFPIRWDDTAEAGRRYTLAIEETTC